MVEEEDLRAVVIATDDREKALFIFAKDAMMFDKLEIHYTEKYAPTVEYLIRMLRVAFGWLEIKRGFKTAKNTRCIFAQGGYCAGPCAANGVVKKCTENARKSCEHYKQKYVKEIEVNYITVEKVGQLRGLR